MVSVDSSDRAWHGVLGLHLSPHTLLCLLLGVPWGRWGVEGRAPTIPGALWQKVRFMGLKFLLCTLYFMQQTGMTETEEKAAQ